MRHIKLFISLIAVTGVVRFILTVSGLPNSAVKYSSMSIIILAGTIYYGATLRGRKDRLKASYLLILPYMVIEGLALGYTLASGQPTIFHTPEYSFGTPLPYHLVGHLVGGLTWEPLSLFVMMEVVYWVSRLFRPAAPAL